MVAYHFATVVERVRFPLDAFENETVLMEQSGVLATLSRWRPRVQIPLGTIGDVAQLVVGGGLRSRSVWVRLPPSPLVIADGPAPDWVS